ncbi:MAG: hypothetical protein PVH61_33695 [Candidatus Aminicenantes bacterium]
MGDEFTFENLVLVMGTNPLPNLVVADYFLQTNKNLKKIILIYSESNNKNQESTQEQAENLKKLLKTGDKPKYKNKNDFEVAGIPVADVGSAKSIEEGLTEKLEKALVGKKSLHFNYTGGTKAMVVHAYRFIERLADMKGIANEFSYYDGRIFRIVMDNGKGDDYVIPNPYTNQDLRDIVSISFKELIELHGFKRDSGKSNNKKKYEGDFFSPLLKEIKNFLSLKDIKDFEGIEEFKDKVKSFVTKFLDNNEEYKKEADEFARWVWLERFIHDELKEKIKNKKLPKINNEKIEVDWDWTISKEGWGTNFQLDIILIYGFQLYAISCTIEKPRRECKLKGFEVIHRAIQIGGDEAKAILFTLRPEVEVLKAELKHETGCDEKNIMVFGINDLPKARFVQTIIESLQKQKGE